MSSRTSTWIDQGSAARSAPRRPILACPAPRCRTPLQPQQGALLCPGCGARLPVVADCLPVAAPQAALHLAEEVVSLQREIERIRARQDLLKAASRRSPARAPVHARIVEGLAMNLGHLERLRALALPHLDVQALLEAAARSERPACAIYGGDKVFTLLRRDWSGAPNCEAELAAILQGLRGVLGGALPRGGSTLVVGAGAGRLAEELAGAGATTWAMDLSFPLLASVVLLADGPLSLCEIRTRNTREVADQVRPFHAALTAGPRAHRPRYVVGDATASPFGSGVFDRIVSVYFTDVVPLPRLLPEVWRLLRPGGRFVHVGPLGYHFDGLDDHLSADEVLARFREAAFQVGAPTWFRSTHHASASALHTTTFENLAFAARRPTGRELGRLRPVEVSSSQAVRRPPFL